MQYVGLRRWIEEKARLQAGFFANKHDFAIPEKAEAKSDWAESPFRFSLMFEHDLFRKPVPLFGIML